MFIEYGPSLAFYTNWLFCFGTLWTNTNNHGRSTIGAWHSTDGGLTWSAPDAIDAPPYDPSCEAAGTCIFDDKPAAALATSNGTIFVAFTRTTPTSTQVYISELIPSRGWASVGLIATTNYLPGPTPVFDPTTNYTWLFTMDRVNQTIRTFYNPGDAGYTLYASRIDLYGFVPETSRIFTSALSDVTGYNLDRSTGSSRIGEYQGLAVLNDVLYAATTYVPQSTPKVGNAWVVKFITP